MENTIPQPEKVLYTAKTRTTGGREGSAQSSDDRLNIKLTSPGAAGPGTNPEQLFAAGWSACFIGAMGIAAGKLGIRLPADTAVDTEVDLYQTGSEYYLQARLNVSLPGIDKETVNTITTMAHQTCPYSKMTRGNVNVTITAV
ncbi:organic hydroperoxide resistance protein [Flavobacterium sp. N1736]|uniref:organic hydroperoxide resistance protein n=1 Tax=Flavobacterium sp. N1736 TaxID=2986823 RepID=UPI00222434EE|nr:organic hydroperoxide resistance protein [Flavobacterium sp. N1736]